MKPVSSSLFRVALIASMAGVTHLLAAGSLLAKDRSGSTTVTGAINVTGGTSGGTGSISGAVTVNSTGATADLLDANDNRNLNGTVTLSLSDPGSNSLLAHGIQFTMISYFGSRTTGDVFNGYADDSTLTVVPEPGNSLLAGLGMPALFRSHR